MLFNSHVFILFFLPAVWLGYVALKRFGLPRVLAGWLVLASLFYYGWWNPKYLLLIGGSLVFNYAFALWISRHPSRIGVALGVAVNLGLLGFFKYSKFVVDNLAALFGTSWSMTPLELPLAISFFTFQQIVYLVDAYRKRRADSSIVDYAVFVCFFPQLIAGPIVHHGETIPQFKRPTERRAEFMAFGLATFTIGLFKKVVIADSLIPFVDAGFGAAQTGTALELLPAWSCALAYSLQLYFDFSGYSDMAVGIAAMFGILIPINFHSPYKAVNLIDFWRRWHITLSRFLRNFLYIPLGGNRKGVPRRYANLLVTMLLGGLWHGAGWNFVLWGGLHGIALALNHGWRALTNRWTRFRPDRSSGMIVSRVLTFLFVVTAWVPFRATDWDSARIVLEGMYGLNETARTVTLPRSLTTEFETSSQIVTALSEVSSSMKVEYVDGATPWTQLVWLLLLILVVWFAPNTQQLVPRPKRAEVEDPVFEGDKPFRLPGGGVWQRSLIGAIVSGLVLTYIVLSLDRVSEFLYYQF